MQKPHNKFKLTPDAYKALMIIAEKLGTFHRRDKNGNLMYRVATKFTGTKNFTPGDRTHRTTYTKMTNHGKEPLLVNHKINLVEIWQKDGQKGVDAYVHFFTVDIKKDRIEKTEKQEA